MKCEIVQTFEWLNCGNIVVNSAERERECVCGCRGLDSDGKAFGYVN